MRTNLPISDIEYPITDETLIVSKTDLKGKLTYFNDQFVQASGFSEQELIGQPHNIIRHPDMPPEAFENLWDTLKAGKPWAGAVKNRRKNGDFYWVLASATPIYRRRPSHRLHVDPDQIAGRSAPRGGASLCAAPRPEGECLPDRCRYDPQAIGVPTCSRFSRAASRLDSEPWSAHWRLRR